MAHLSVQWVLVFPGWRIHPCPLSPPGYQHHHEDLCGQTQLCDNVLLRCLCSLSGRMAEKLIKLEMK